MGPGCESKLFSAVLTRSKCFLAPHRSVDSGLNLRARPSAIWLRHEFPVHTNRTFSFAGAFEEVLLAFLDLGLRVPLLAHNGCLLGDFAVQQRDPRQRCQSDYDQNGSRP